MGERKEKEGVIEKIKEHAVTSNSPNSSKKEGQSAVLLNA